MALSIPVVLLLLRPAPRSRAPVRESAPPADAVRDTAAPPRLRLSDPRFARLLGAFFFLALGVSVFVLHLVPMLGDAGISPATRPGSSAAGAGGDRGRLVIGVALALLATAPPFPLANGGASDGLAR